MMGSPDSSSHTELERELETAKGTFLTSCYLVLGLSPNILYYKVHQNFQNECKRVIRIHEASTDKDEIKVQDGPEEAALAICTKKLTAENYNGTQKLQDCVAYERMKAYGK